MDPKTPESIHARVGTVLRDKWELGQVIGAGGTAAVYEGRHRANGRRVAVKVMHSFLASSEDVVARFQREGYIANKVGHAGAVDILDDGTTEDGAPFLVMERLEGAPLTQLLERKRDGLEVGPTLRIAHDILDILATAHEKGILHRDIKPDNVFLTVTGGVMLLDFGIARLHERLWEEAGIGVTAQATRTQDGFTLGTPLYMAPEQARGRWAEVDPRSDLWSVGAIMFRLLTGRPIRSAANPADMLVQAMSDRPPRLADVGPNVPPEVAGIVDRALEFEKVDRWPDARAMQTAIRDVATHLASIRAPAAPPLLILGAPGPGAARERVRGKGGRIAAVAGLAVAGLLALAYAPRAALTPSSPPAAVASTTTASALFAAPSLPPAEPSPLASSGALAPPRDGPPVVNTVSVDELPVAPPVPPPSAHRAHRHPAAPAAEPEAPSLLDRRH